MSSLVSVITPVFQGHHTLKRAVESMLAQTYPYWEMLIVSDDGEDYQRLLNRQGIADPRLRFFHSSSPRSGPNLTRNIALEAAKGDLIAPLDADDLYYPSRLQRLVPLALVHGVSGDNARVMVEGYDGHADAELGTALPAYRGVRWLDVDRYCHTTTPLIFMFRRDLILQGWNPRVLLGEDTLFNLRSLAKAGGAAFIGEPLHEYHVHHRSLCHSDDATKRADDAYHYCLQQIDAGGMGLALPKVQQQVRNMLERKRAINRAYDTALRQGFEGSYQHFTFANYLITEELPDGQI